MKPLLLLAMMSVAAAAVVPPLAAAADDTARKELAPTGTLRVGVAYAPLPTPVFVACNAGGEVHGVARDLGLALAQALGLPVEIAPAATTGELTEALGAGTIDIGFMPVDDERRKRLDFSPPYFIIESTYLAAVSSDIRSLADVDRPQISVVGVAGSTTMRAASRTLKSATVVPAASVEEALALLRSGRVQALALTHDSLPPLQRQLSGSRILEGAFQTTGVAIGLPKNRPAALAAVTRFIEQAKADGTVRRAFDDAGLGNLTIAPAAEH